MLIDILATDANDGDSNDQHAAQLINSISPNCRAFTKSVKDNFK
jgi:hypothetical protein